MTINQGMNLRIREALGISRDAELPRGGSYGFGDNGIFIDGHRAWVAARVDDSSRYTHRVMIMCNKCLKTVSAGRWEQHCKGSKHNA